MVSTPEVETVIAWHEALNTGDVDGLLALSSDDVEVGGPKGSGREAALLRDWAARAGIQMAPGRVFRRAATVVVEESARWRSAEDGSLSEPLTIASVFVVRGGRVQRVVRHDSLAAALAAAGLDESDEHTS